MKNCANCGKPIEWDKYWTAWDHVGARKLTAELCQPERGWESDRAWPAP